MFSESCKLSVARDMRACLSAEETTWGNFSKRGATSPSNILDKVIYSCVSSYQDAEGMWERYLRGRTEIQ